MTDIYKLIENLTADELIELNKDIVEIARELRRKESLDASRKFKMGDEVYFIDQGKKIKGTFLAVNSKRIKIDGNKQVVWVFSSSVFSPHREALAIG